MFFMSLEDDEGVLEERLDLRVLQVRDEGRLQESVDRAVVGQFVLGLAPVEGRAVQLA